MYYTCDSVLWWICSPPSLLSMVGLENNSQIFCFMLNEVLWYRKINTKHSRWYVVWIKHKNYTVWMMVYCGLPPNQYATWNHLDKYYCKTTHGSNSWLSSGEEFAEVSWVRGLLDQMIDLSANTQGHPLLDPLQLLLQSDENPLRHLVSGLSLSTRGCGVVAGLPSSVKERRTLFPRLLPPLKVHGL